MDKEQILVVDDDEGLLHLLKMRLSAEGFAVTSCTTGHEALVEAKKKMFDLAVTDLRLHGEDGLDVTEELLRIHPQLPVIILTAHGSIPNAVEAMQRGAFGYLTKPFDDKELKATIEKALSQQRMSKEIQRLKSLVKELYGLENVVARSPAMQRLFQQIAQVADSDATILLFGETGTGKEVMARVAHTNSRRSKGPFVALNCAAIPEALFESELFGHVRGAFTSAHGAKKGLFQSANGGTIFLDEIGEMPLSMQVKLLRAVQEREVREVGSELSTKIDVRIIAATNKDLGEAVKNGSFRNDLYYRISVVPLFIPPLRDRRDDIPLLAQHFLKISNQRANKDVRGFTPTALHRLMVNPWPGNVRELENAIEKAVVMTRQDMITPDLLPSVGVSPDTPLKPLTEAKEEFERTYLKNVLQLTGGNISRAAQFAGRYRADFYKMLRKYGLHPSTTKGKIEADIEEMEDESTLMEADR
ncbi:sigma-54-dependent transcriptional regulator [Nitrospira lenta]|uniref:Putative DNA-binding response regulator in two-component system n=1 Tax=Nitrospira lenta TaxID=1436998 RepID=A0A330L613_9BACT|nr:sigma-54 dependent transcriptional regulator [Nitrospira lenta]SPP65265.1 putative DNA-binding response regulator in two-component system [Nitrospira lenta]